MRYDSPSSIEVAAFAYHPLIDGKVKLANQIRNTAAGSIHISTDVSEFVRRINALELEKTGILLNDKSEIQLSGDIIEFYIDDVGYSATIHYSIMYIIRNKSGKVLYSKTFTPTPLKVGKFGTAAEAVQSLNGQVSTAYDMFIKDQAVRDILNTRK